MDLGTRAEATRWPLPENFTKQQCLLQTYVGCTIPGGGPTVVALTPEMTEMSGISRG